MRSLGIRVERVSRRFDERQWRARTERDEPARGDARRRRHGRTTGSGGIDALREVSLEVQPGELVAVVGASGCGKTTLLRIIGGLDQATSGSVSFFDGAGGSVRIDPRDLGFCFQDPRLLPWRSAEDNVALPLELAGVPRRERRARAAEALAMVRLSGRERSLPAALSGGMRMRVALARAMVTGPRVLLLDEPFSALDEVTRLELDGELLSLRAASGATILLVTHAISEAVLLADRIVVLGSHPGRVRSVLAVELPEHGVMRLASPGLAPLTARILDLIAQGREVGAAVGSGASRGSAGGADAAPEAPSAERRAGGRH